MLGYNSPIGAQSKKLEVQDLHPGTLGAPFNSGNVLMRIPVRQCRLDRASPREPKRAVARKAVKLGCSVPVYELFASEAHEKFHLRYKVVSIWVLQGAPYLPKYANCDVHFNTVA